MFKSLRTAPLADLTVAVHEATLRLTQRRRAAGTGSVPLALDALDEVQEREARPIADLTPAQTSRWIGKLDALLMARVRAETPDPAGHGSDTRSTRGGDLPSS